MKGVTEELFKPEDALSPSVASALSKWSDEVADAVAQTLDNIRGHCLAHGDMPPKD
ncbi:hypothetical protein AGMMS49546_39430 [Spirochaetia bacterium]|nr:hypothetical protein AGMMS49546_39430 [Spirochaetia bacterium]